VGDKNTKTRVVVFCIINDIVYENNGQTAKMVLIIKSEHIYIRYQKEENLFIYLIINES